MRLGHSVTIYEGFSEMKTNVEWQPIETAPKDGTPILLIDVNDAHCILYFSSYTDHEFDEIISGWTPNGSIFYVNVEFTHWMRLPDPPKDK